MQDFICELGNGFDIQSLDVRTCLSAVHLVLSRNLVIDDMYYMPATLARGNGVSQHPIAFLLLPIVD